MAAKVGALTGRTTLGWWNVPLSALGWLRRLFAQASGVPSMVYAEDERMSRRILVH